MNERTWMRSRILYPTIENLKCTESAENPKSKIVGDYRIVITIAMGEVVGQAQQPTKIPRIGFLRRAALRMLRGSR